MATTEQFEKQPPVSWREVRELLGRRSFLALVATRVIGQIGDGMVQAALASFVLFSPERQATPAKIAIAFAILLLPYSVFGPFIGVLIDRWPRQRILLFASLARAVSVALIAAVVITKDEGVLLGTAVLVSLGIGRFMLATLSASLPHVARDRELVTANAFAPTAGTMASAIGGLLGVGIAQVGGSAGTLLTLGLSAVLQLCAALVASTIARNSLGPDSVVRGLREQMLRVARELHDGVQHLRKQQRAARAIGIVTLHRSGFGMVSVTAIILIRHALNLPNETTSALGELAITVGGAAVGALIGAAMAPIMVGRFGIQKWTAIALVIGGVKTCFWFSLLMYDPKASYAVPALIAGGAFIGWVGQSVKVCSDSIVQHSIDDDHRGRVFAIYDMAVNFALFTGIGLAAIVLPANGVTYAAAIYPLITLFSALLLLRTPPLK